jgi:hypothetical protein
VELLSPRDGWAGWSDVLVIQMAIAHPCYSRGQCRVQLDFGTAGVFPLAEQVRRSGWRWRGGKKGKGGRLEAPHRRWRGGREGWEVVPPPLVYGSLLAVRRPSM